MTAPAKLKELHPHHNECDDLPVKAIKYEYSTLLTVNKG